MTLWLAPLAISPADTHERSLWYPAVGGTDRQRDHFAGNELCLPNILWCGFVHAVGWFMMLARPTSFLKKLKIHWRVHVVT